MIRSRNISTGFMSLAIIFVMTCLVSCTLVDFTGTPLNSFDDLEDIENSQTTKVRFEIKWPSGLSEQDTPQYVTLLMNRIQNSTVHYVYYLDNVGNILESFDPSVSDPEPDGVEEPDQDASVAGLNDDGDTPENEGSEGDAADGEVADGEDSENDAEEGEDAEVEEPEADPNDGLPLIRNGLYSIAAVAATDRTDYIASSLDLFADSLAYSMKDVYVSIPRLTEADKTENMYVDYNPMHPYIKSVSPFYFVRPSIQTHTEIWSDKNEVMTIMLNPMPLTRKVTVKVPFKLEEGVVIERLTGALSGVPERVQLMTGYVSNRDSGKVPFEMTSEDGYNFESSINVFGLFPPTDTIQMAGPGILTLTIYVKTEKDGINYGRMFYANVNMKKTIDAAEVMILSPDRTAYRFSDTQNTDNNGNYLKIRDYSIAVDISQLEKITKDMVITGAGHGFTVWKPVVGNDDKEQNPGLHPEL